MGAAAASLADVAILSSDNPRSEDPLAILAAMLDGVLSVPQDQRARVIIEPDRAAAISQAVALATPGDVIVVAGKGHETGQYVAGAVLPFDDREVTAAALAQRDRAQRDRDQRGQDQLGPDPLGPLRAEPLTPELDPWTVNR
jgi:UDP-N-acetylmuramoyl-L-alanyl-D-glutamate--2,6-diaminopimelate ligase